MRLGNLIGSRKDNDGINESNKIDDHNNKQFQNSIISNI
jgi:hypothetical protein